VMEIGLITEMI